MRFSWLNQQFKQISLKKFLKHHGISHRMFSRLKESNGIFLNHRLIKASLPLKLNDRVTVNLLPEGSDPHLKVSPKPINVLFEDPNWLVINKPAGLTSVPGPSNRSDTVVNRVKNYLLNEGSRNLRPHLITRLDRFTSGVMLIAKHRLANSLANQMLTHHLIKKIYLAMVSGRLASSHGQIKMPIGKTPGEIRRHFMKNGQWAWTEYWVVSAFPQFTLVRVRLHTGRTHQVRVHFTETGHPLLGDHLYGGPFDFGIRRQALHARSLAFLDPFTKHRLRFKVPLPLDMRKVIWEANHEES